MENRNILTLFPSLVVPLLVILIAVFVRLVPHAPNFTPIGAMALFGGCYLPRRMAFILPIAAMLISDFFLGFHQSMPFVYVSFVITVLLGILLRRRKTPVTIITTALASSVIFFLITNFGFWLTDSLYPKTLTGQIHAYYYALPFFRNSLLGDVFYAVLFFGGYELMVRLLQALRLERSQR